MGKFIWLLFVNLIVIGSCISLFSSCNEHASSKNEKTHTFGSVTPTTLSMKPPSVVSLDTCPRPQVVKVPTSLGGTYVRQTDNGNETIHLSPPKITPAGFNIPLQHYDVEDGLATSYVTCSLRDKDGNLWFGTGNGGVSRFDGKSFTTYTVNQGLVDDQLHSIFQDNKGNMWFGTWNGVAKYDGRVFRQFADYNIRNNSNNNGVPCCRFFSISQTKNGDMWFGTTDGAAKFDGKSFTSVNTKDGLPSNE